MKKLALSAAFIVLITGFAAAQSKISTPKAITRKADQKELKKGSDKIVSSSSHAAKQDTVILAPLKIDVPKPGADTTVVPKVKNIE